MPFFEKEKFYKKQNVREETRIHKDLSLNP